MYSPAQGGLNPSSPLGRALDISHLVWEYTTFHFHQASESHTTSLPWPQKMMSIWPKWTREFEPRTQRHTVGRCPGLSHFAGSLHNVPIPGIPGTAILGAVPVCFFLRLVFFFKSAFSCITPISSLLLELASICFCCLQAKDHNVMLSNDNIKMVLGAVPDSLEVILLVLMQAV